jgi:TPR repeat protein
LLCKDVRNIPLLWAILAVSALAADFKTGLAAYNRGDFAAALQEWQPIAEKGDAHAQYNLGLLYARGQGVGQDHAKAAEWYEKAAEQGVAAAQYNLGVMYANGQGVQANAEAAAKWFLKAAEQGVTDAQAGLGNIYHEGEGAFRNYAEAEKWYRKAAEQGVANAAFHLGVMYDLGQGVQRDYAEAMKWYQKAADGGYPGAMANLGILYYNGQGAKRDLVQAYAWFDRAQRLGDPRAGELLGATQRKLKPGDLKKAQTLAMQWQPPSKGQTQVADARLFKPAPETQASASAPPAQGGVAPRGEAARAAPETQAAAQAGAPRQGTQGEAAQAATETQAAARSGAPQQGTQSEAARTAAASAPSAQAGAQATETQAAAQAGAPQTPPEQKTSPASPAIFTDASRVVAVGDLHGDYEQFTGVLASAGLIDGNGDWVGGKAHLVQTGDVLDRGPDSRPIMDLLIKLEKQAAAAGGAVHALIGNHEAMNVYGDLRYVSPGEFASYAHGQGAEAEFSYAERAALTQSAKPVPAAMPATNHSAGFPEHRAAFSPEGPYGRWIRSHNAAVKINRTLFLHAGLGRKYADWTIDRINDEVRRELNDFTRLHGGVVTDEEGPLWYRGLATGNQEELAPLVDELLKNFDVDRIVIGHSYAQAAITPRFGGKVVLIDIGLSRVYDNVGKLGCLEIEGDRVVAIHRGQRLELPKDETGADMLRYLRSAAALDPAPSPLLARIAELQK